MSVIGRASIGHGEVDGEACQPHGLNARYRACLSWASRSRASAEGEQMSQCPLSGVPLLGATTTTPRTASPASCLNARYRACLSWALQPNGGSGYNWMSQ